MANGPRWIVWWTNGDIVSYAGRPDDNPRRFHAALTREDVHRYDSKPQAYGAAQEVVTSGRAKEDEVRVEEVGED
jgi:hypothetical protein